MHDIVIRNGRIIDGTGTPKQTAEKVWGAACVGAPECEGNRS